MTIIIQIAHSFVFGRFGCASDALTALEGVVACHAHILDAMCYSPEKGYAWQVSESDFIEIENLTGDARWVRFQEIEKTLIAEA
jgi:hypothetical protein